MRLIGERPCRARLTIGARLAIALGLCVTALATVAAPDSPDLQPRGGPQPGVHTIESLHSRLCITAGSFLHQVSCQPRARIALQPHPRGGYTLRSPDEPLLQRPLCATVARGVVLGPKRLDMALCEAPPAARSMCEAGTDDQRVYPERLGDDVWRLRTSSGRCIDVRDRSTAGGAELIEFDCHDGGNQRFRLRWTAELPSPEGRQCVKDQGWAGASDGWWRAKPVASVNFYGGDYGWAPTPDDGGRECARACIEQPRCKAYTWVRAGAQRDFPVCWFKDRVPAPTADPNTASGQVRP